MKVILPSWNNPYHNVAVERYLFDHFEEDILYFWINQPCVVIGRNQNSWFECDLDYMNDNHILLVRRYTGGGAVFQDYGNLNYSFFSKTNSIDWIIQLISNTLQEFGIQSIQSSRNDLLIDGKKFSGTASMVDNGKHLYHGTLMFDVNEDHLSKVLKPSKLKMKTHGITSVRSRVVNLKDILPTITQEDFLNVLCNKLEQVELIPHPNDSWIEEEIKHLSSEKWLKLETPTFETVIEYRIDNANYQVFMNVKNGLLDEVNISTDSLSVLSFESLQDSLKGMIFSDKEIEKKLVQYLENHL